VAADKKLLLSGAALHLVVANLLSNAVTHGRDGALITVTAGDDSLIVENQVDSEAAHGSGSTDSTRPGHGLGIAIVRRTLERYGYALSLMREGSIFRARVDSSGAA
jgi:signal transduction histidine kinase